MNSNKDWFFPTAFSHWGEEEHAAMQRVIASGRFTMGDETAAFEEELAAFSKRKHAIAVNSGSSANLIAVAALEIDRREKGTLVSDDDFSRHAVIPALAWATTYAPFVQHGYELTLLDCDETWCAPVARLEPTVACSILGNPAYQWCLEASVLNDDCEAFGATIDGRPTASFGTIATQSFFYSHQLSAIEGGACLTDDDDLAKTMRMLRDHGLTRSFQKPANFEAEYDFHLFGYNVRPVEMHMAVAREQLKKAALHRTARRKNWHLFHGLVTMASLPVTSPLMGDGANPFGLHFTVETPLVRRELAAALRANGIDCRLPTGGSFRMHKYGAPWADQQTPNADRIHKTGLFLGNAPYDIGDQVERAANVIERVLRQ